MILVLGGARSGKSRYAERLVTACPPPWVYVATAEPRDDEMRERIAQHRARRGPDWRVIEAPRDLAGALATHAAGGAVLVDCLTLWLSNLMLVDVDIAAATERLEAVLSGMAGPVVWSRTRSASASCPTTRWRGASATPRDGSTSASRRAPSASC